MSKNLFVSTSFSSKVDDAGGVFPEFRTEIEELLAGLRFKKMQVYCAVEAENWLNSAMPPETGVEHDMEQIDKCDLLLAILEDKPSWGVQYEMGYAVAKGKIVLAATSQKVKLAYFNQGLSKLDKIKHVSYHDINSLVEVVLGIL